MLHDIRITADQAIALGEWAEPNDHPAAVELAVIDNHLVANQGDDYCAWTSAGLAVDDGALDALLELGRDPLARSAESSTRQERNMLSKGTAVVDNPDYYNPTASANGAVAMVTLYAREIIARLQSRLEANSR
jgi:hypothetical protein